MANKVKKVDTKKLAKEEMSTVVREAFAAAGLTVEDGTDYGFKTGTLVVKGVQGHDIQIGFTAPKAGQDTYDYCRVEEDAE